MAGRFFLVAQVCCSCSSLSREKKSDRSEFALFSGSSPSCSGDIEAATTDGTNARSGSQREKAASTRVGPLASYGDHVVNEERLVPSFPVELVGEKEVAAGGVDDVELPPA